MPLYKVEISTYVVVEAEDEQRAEELALDALKSREIDESEFDASTVNEIRCISELPDEWDEKCLPYGHMVDSTIGRILGI